MSEGNTNSFTYSTIPSYEQIKNKIVNQLAIAENLYGEFTIKEDFLRENKARTSIIKLMLAVSDYLYVIDDSEDKQYFSYMLSNPDKLNTMTRLGAMLSVCKDIVYNLGITQIETGKINPWESYSELE